MTPASLLRLYPRAWRERYGEEFLEACGAAPLGAQQILDMIGGAIDARLSPQRHLAEASRVAGGSVNTIVSRLKCRTPANYTTRDGVISAAFMVGASVALTGASVACRQAGWVYGADFFKAFAFPASVILSSHFTFLKGQPRTAQVLISGTTLVLIGLLSGLAASLSTR